MKSPRTLTVLARHVRRASARHSTPAANVGDRLATLSQMAIERLLTETSGVLLSADVERNRLAGQLRDYARRIEAGRRMKPSLAASQRLSVTVSGVVHDWHRNRRYSDWDSGDPVPLPLQLRRDLIGGRLPRHKIDPTLAWMEGDGYVDAQPDGRFALAVGRHVIDKLEHWRWSVPR